MESAAQIAACIRALTLSAVSAIPDLQTSTFEQPLEYLSKHAGSNLASGAVITAPSTTATILRWEMMMSHLRIVFSTVGCGKTWHAEEAHGN